MTDTPTKTALRALAWMTGALAGFSSMAVAGRELNGQFDTFEIMTYRSLVGLVIVVTILSATGKWPQIGFGHLKLHAGRNLAHFTGQNLWFFAVGVIPLAQVFALEFTAPLWVLLLAPFMLGEKTTACRMLAGFLGFVGILIVTRPFSAPLSPGIIAAALAAICFAFTAVATSKLTRTEPLLAILFFLTGMQAVFGLTLAGFDGAITLPSAQNWYWLVLVGIAGLVAHFCLTSALRIAPVTVVMPIDFLRLPLIALVGWLLYDEALEWAVLIGALFILTGNWINIRGAKRRPG